MLSRDELIDIAKENLIEGNRYPILYYRQLSQYDGALVTAGQFDDFLKYIGTAWDVKRLRTNRLHMYQYNGISELKTEDTRLKKTNKLKYLICVRLKMRNNRLLRHRFITFDRLMYDYYGAKSIKELMPYGNMHYMNKMRKLKNQRSIENYKRAMMMVSLVIYQAVYWRLTLDIEEVASKTKDHLYRWYLIKNKRKSSKAERNKLREPNFDDWTTIYNYYREVIFLKIGKATDEELKHYCNRNQYETINSELPFGIQYVGERVCMFYDQNWEPPEAYLDADAVQERINERLCETVMEYFKPVARDEPRLRKVCLEIIDDWKEYQLKHVQTKSTAHTHI